MHGLFYFSVGKVPDPRYTVAYLTKNKTIPEAQSYRGLHPSLFGLMPKAFAKVKCLFSDPG